MPSAEIWSAGQKQILSIIDSIEVVPSKMPIFLDDLFSPKKSQKPHNQIDIQFDCAASRVCTKAWFIKTNFHKGDTVVLVVAINKARASIKIPEIKGMSYLTHSTISNAQLTNGVVKEYKYVASSFVLLKDMKRIKTKTLRIKYGSSTYYVPKVKLKNPHF